MHIFPYSVRPGTKAAAMPDQVENAEKAARAHRAQLVADEMRRSYLAACVGKTLQVLFETEQEDTSVGHAENYTEVAAPGGKRGSVQSVRVTGVADDRLIGVLC